MSEALRELADAPDSAFDPEPENAMPAQGEASTTQESVETDPEQQPQQRETGQPRKVSKAKVKEDATARDQRRADAAYAKLERANQETQRLLQENARLQAEFAKAQEERKIESDAFLKEAINLHKQGYTTEDLEGEAQRMDAAGDAEGARGLRAIAVKLRNYLAQQGEQQQQHAQMQAQTAWRTHAFGTPEFDQAAFNLKKGTQEFDDCWGTCEQGMIERLANSADPIDQEISKTFRDHTSPFGKRMVEFLGKHPLGRAFKGFAMGIVPAVDMVKQALVIDRQGKLIDNLTKELNHYRGLTAIGGGAPASYVAGEGASPNHMSQDLSYAELQNLPMDKFRERLRARAHA